MGGRFGIFSGIASLLMDKRGSGKGIKGGEMIFSDSAKGLGYQSEEFYVYSSCKGDNPKIWWEGSIHGVVCADSEHRGPL